MTVRIVLLFIFVCVFLFTPDSLFAGEYPDTEKGLWLDLIHDVFVFDKSELKKKWVNKEFPVEKDSALQGSFVIKDRGLYEVSVFTKLIDKKKLTSELLPSSFALTLSLYQKDKKILEHTKKYQDYHALGTGTFYMFRCPELVKRKAPVRYEIRLTDFSDQFKENYSTMKLKISRRSPLLGY